MYGTTHRGGGLLFGDDGYLYLTTGDQTAFKKSQDIINNLDGGSCVLMWTAIPPAAMRPSGPCPRTMVSMMR